MDKFFINVLKIMGYILFYAMTIRVLNKGFIADVKIMRAFKIAGLEKFLLSFYIFSIDLNHKMIPKLKI